MVGTWQWKCYFHYNNEPEVPEEILSSHVEVQEEMMQKGNEDVKYIELIEVPDSENVSEIVLENDLENNTQKAKVQSKITSFFTA